MTRARDQRPETTSDDARFVEVLRDAYAPEPLGPARRAALDAELRERIARRARCWRVGGAAAAVAATAAMAWWLLPVSPTALPGSAPAAAPQRAEATPAPESPAGGDVEAWELELLYGSDAAQPDGEAELPEEYLAIASVLLDG